MSARGHLRLVVDQADKNHPLPALRLERRPPHGTNEAAQAV